MLISCGEREVALNTSSLPEFQESLLSMQQTSDRDELTAGGIGIQVLMLQDQLGRQFAISQQEVDLLRDKALRPWPNLTDLPGPNYQTFTRNMLEVAGPELNGLTIDGLVAVHDQFFADIGMMIELPAGGNIPLATSRAQDHLNELQGLDREPAEISLQEARSALEAIEGEMAARAEAAQNLVSDFEIEAVAIDNNGHLRVRPSFTVTNVLDMPIRIIGLEMRFNPTDNQDAPTVQQTFQLYRGTADGLAPGEKREHEHPVDFAVPPGSDAYKTAVTALGGYPTDPDAYEVEARAYAAIPPARSGHQRWNAEERALTQEAARLRAATERCEAGLASLQSAIEETERRIEEIETEGGSVRPLPQFTFIDLMAACPSSV